MAITRFGDTYLTAYALPTLKGEQPQEVNRPPVVAAVSGADGEFDFFGDDPFPLSAKEITLKGELHGTSYANITTESDNLKQYTIALGRSKLWQETRNTAAAIPIRWANAKCIAVQEGEFYGRNYTNYPVTLVFRLSEGVWYSENAITRTVTRIGSYEAVNSGSYDNPPINVTLTANTYPIISVRVWRRLGLYIIAPTPYLLWADDGPSVQWDDLVGNGVEIGNVLEIDSADMAVTNDGVDAYANASGNSTITLGDNQVGWLSLNLKGWALGTLSRRYYIMVGAAVGGNITAVGNTTPISITTGVAHGMSSGKRVRIFSTGITDGSFVITVTGAQTFTLNGTAASGAGSSGRWTMAVSITGVTNTGAPITVTTAIAHGLANGNYVYILGTGTDADGVWEVDNATAYTIDLVEEYTGTGVASYNVTTWVSGGLLCYNPLVSGTAEWYQAFTA